MNKVNISSYEYLIEENQALVYKIARRFKVNAFDFDDLVQAGFMGLLKAASRYDCQKNVKFATYATYFVIGAIKDEYRKLFMINSKNYYQLIKTRKPSENDQIDETDKIIANHYFNNDLIVDKSSCENSVIDFHQLNSFEKAIIKLRLKYHYTQTKIGKELGVNQSTISRTIKKLKKLLLDGK